MEGQSFSIEQARWFAEEVQPHESALRAFLRSRFPLIHDVDDLVQEAYARLFRAQRVGNITNTKSFLYTTARNIALDQCRHRQVVQLGALGQVSDLPVLEDRPNAAELASHAQELELLGEAIDTLPPRCREILILRRIRGLSHLEIASKLGIAERTVNAQLAIGVARCRDYLVARGVFRDGPVRQAGRMTP